MKSGNVLSTDDVNYIDSLVKLWDMLSDAVESSRLTMADIPDDYEALCRQMESCEQLRHVAQAPAPTTPAHHKMIDKALVNPAVCVSVHDGEELAVRNSRDRKEIIDCIESVEDATVQFRLMDAMTREGSVLGTAYVIPFGVGPDETIADYGVNPYMEQLIEG